MPTLTPVDHDPFPNLVPVDYDPFVDNPLAQYNAVAQAIGREVVRPAVETYEHAANLVQGRGDYGMELTSGLLAAAGLAAPPAAKGEALAERAAERGFEAWHGSSADFTRFSDEFIGTGEGGQAFGRGHYVAENKGVGSSYRKAGIQAKTYHELMAQQYLEQAGNDPILAKLNYQHDGSPGGARAIDKLIDNYAKHKGHLYNVRVNADPEHFVDWDKPLSEQRPEIQKAFRAAIDEFGERPWYAPKNRDQLYDFSKSAGQLIDMLGFEARALNKPTILEDSLKSHGIPGIKYLDQGSRGAKNELYVKEDNGEFFVADLTKTGPTSGPFKTAKEAQSWIDATPQTRNFVVFNPDTIEILKKYGIAGLISAGIAHQSMTPIDHDPFKDGS